MRAAEIFDAATPIRIREPRPFGLGKVMVVVVLLAVIGFGAYRLVSTHNTHSTATPAATVRPTVSAKPHATASAVAHHPSQPVEAVIKVTAIQDCWVGLTNSSGQQFYQGIVPAGNTMTWRELHPVSMVIGNPGGIVLTVNGKAEHMSTTQVVTLSINPSSKTPVDTTSPITAVSAPSPSATP
jgi:hypothetical protein